MAGEWAVLKIRPSPRGLAGRRDAKAGRKAREARGVIREPMVGFLRLKKLQEPQLCPSSFPSQTFESH